MTDYLRDFICNELNLDFNNIKSITKLHSLNNLCYKIKYLNDTFFFRISNKEYDNFIQEKNTIVLSSKHNICPNLYYYSTHTGNMISEWINGTSPSEIQFSSYSFIKKLVDKLKVLHSLNIENYFNPFTEIRSNIERCKLLNIELPSYIKILINKLAEIEKYCSKQINYGFCHNDLNPFNFILSNDDLYIIDYEFSGVNDIFFDLATLSWMMTDKGRSLLLHTYFNKVTNYHYKKLHYYLFVVKFRNASWSLLKSVTPTANYDYKKGAEIIFEELNNFIL